uniref:Vacuolar protein sorting-associated protein 72 homolog n=1 Tax=Petromyzon marinus TaxID=7757 RepID=S4RYS6_PETMA
MALSLTREPRKNAGNKMSKLLDAEEDDDFYKTTYGGFNDESGDDEFKSDVSASEDEVDSDFDIDEGDEPASDHEEDDAPKKKRRVVTKAYKEPVKVNKPTSKSKTRKSSDDRGRMRRKNARLVNQGSMDLKHTARKAMRHSTAECTRQTYLRVKEREELPKRQRKRQYEESGRVSQQQLLAEAKITEELNLRSLENYERLEADKKKQVLKKHHYTGPVIRYHSLTMPLITELPIKEENVDVEGLDQESQPTAESAQVTSSGKCSRNFITFTDEETFNQIFAKPKVPLRVPVREICPVTHKPALYRDPITDIPYANPRAFKIIREAYRTYVATHGMPASSSQSGAGTTAASTATSSPATSAQSTDSGIRAKSKPSS